MKNMAVYNKFLLMILSFDIYSCTIHQREKSKNKINTNITNEVNINEINRKEIDINEMNRNEIDKNKNVLNGEDFFQNVYNVEKIYSDSNKNIMIDSMNDDDNDYNFNYYDKDDNNNNSYDDNDYNHYSDNYKYDINNNSKNDENNKNDNNDDNDNRNHEKINEKNGKKKQFLLSDTSHSKNRKKRKLNTVERLKKKGLLVIPGLGRIDRLKIVLYNIQLLINGNYLLKKNDIVNQNINTKNHNNNNDNDNNYDNNDSNNNNNNNNNKSYYNHNKNNKNNNYNNRDRNLLKEIEKQKYENSWDCIIYIYSDKNENNNNVNDKNFWSKKDDLDYLRLYCDLIENPNKMVTENLFLVNPHNLDIFYDYVFILLDDCKLLINEIMHDKKDNILNRNRKNKMKNDIKSTFNLNKILHLMKVNNLTVASPMVLGANRGGGQQFRTIMQRDAPIDTQGFISTFVEIFAWVLTVPAYSALHQILQPDINPFGWGYDFWYDNHAKKNVKGHRMGIVSTVKVSHEQDTSSAGLGRTDSNSVEKKWKALRNQEKYYKKKLNIDLKLYREKLDLKNNSWNGAVIGYLYDN